MERHPPPPPVLDVHTRLNLQGLIQRLHALPGVSRYLFCAGLDAVLLLSGEALGPEQPGCSLELAVPPGPGGDAEPASPSVIALLPLSWARGLVAAERAPSLEKLVAAAGGACLTLNALSWPADNSHRQATVPSGGADPGLPRPTGPRAEPAGAPAARA